MRTSEKPSAEFLHRHPPAALVDRCLKDLSRSEGGRCQAGRTRSYWDEVDSSRITVAPVLRCQDFSE